MQNSSLAYFPATGSGALVALPGEDATMTRALARMDALEAVLEPPRRIRVEAL